MEKTCNWSTVLMRLAVQYNYTKAEAKNIMPAREKFGDIFRLLNEKMLNTTFQYWRDELIQSCNKLIE